MTVSVKTFPEVIVAECPEEAEVRSAGTILGRGDGRQSQAIERSRLDHAVDSHVLEAQS